MQTLVLTGKSIKTQLVESFLGEIPHTLKQETPIARAVRLLENEMAPLVILIPDPDDTSWLSALKRIRDEYTRRPVLIADLDKATEIAAFEAGAFDVLSPEFLSPKCIAHCMQLLQNQLQLKVGRERETTTLDWVEKSARIGTWQMQPDGKTIWSKGLKNILRESPLLTEDFSSLGHFIHPDDLTIYDQANKASFEQGWPLNFEYRLKHSNGTISYLRIHRRVELNPQGKIERAYGIVHDVTPERELEIFLFRRDAILQVVGRFAKHFLQETDWGQLPEILEALGKAADVTHVLLLQKQHGHALNAPIAVKNEWAEPTTEPFLNAFGSPQKALELNKRWRGVLDNRKIIAGNTKDFQTSERQSLEALNIKALILIPIFVGNEWWGILTLLDHHSERKWAPTEIESMTMVAEMLGASVLRASIEDQLIDARRSAEAAQTEAFEASKAKSRFLANMSHEIRTPTSGILGMVEMAITTGMTQEQREHMDMIRSAARSLLTIVNDVLDISKIEASKMELTTVDFDLRSAVETTLGPFGPLSEAKNIVFLHEIDEKIPTFVHGDPDRLGQILMNLVGNALKFTEKGLIEVHVDLIQSLPTELDLRFTVRDTGEGIPEEKLQTIFDSFTQVDSSTGKTHQGTGLGLAISKELVKMMDGKIEVKSKVGQGSIFTFTARLGQIQGAIHKEEIQDALQITPMSSSILLAEDNPMNQKYLTHFLTLFGHTVTIAGNGIEALEILEKKGQTIDVVLMDIQMPEMDGIKTTQAIRQSNGVLYDKNIPIIALTAYAMKGDREWLLESGMNDYVSKPVDIKELSALIATLMTSHKDGKPVTSKQSHGAQNIHHENEKTDQQVQLDMESLTKRFQGNTTLLKDILGLFLLEADDKLAEMDAGLQANDTKRLGFAFHSITNISSHVLALEICDRSRELEKRCYKGEVERIADDALAFRPMFVALIKEVRRQADMLKTTPFHKDSKQVQHLPKEW